MALTENQKNLVENTIRTSLRNRFKTYNPEPAVMPLHTRLLGKDRLALYSFIHSLNTNFGTTIFEPVAVALTSDRFKVADKQLKSGTKISTAAQFEIQKIMDNLTAANEKPNKPNEVEIIRRVCQEGEMRTVKPTRVDVYLESHSDEIYLTDIKTAKPNKGGFKEFKRTLFRMDCNSFSRKSKSKRKYFNCNTIQSV
jgi:type II restriction enzyme